LCAKIILSLKYFTDESYVVGAGAVGATCADNIAVQHWPRNWYCWTSRKAGRRKSAGYDANRRLLGFDTRITGSTNDYTKTAGSDVVSSPPASRKPGMTRED